MPYGPEKITASKAIDSILEVIKDELLKNDAFSNQSMAYYGLELSYKIDVKLHARQMTERGISGETSIGETTDPTPVKVSRKGRQVAGRKLTVKAGEHTRDREGVAV